jgi:hypothetical protein
VADQTELPAEALTEAPVVAPIADVAPAAADVAEPVAAAAAEVSVAKPVRKPRVAKVVAPAPVVAKVAKPAKVKPAARKVRKPRVSSVSAVTPAQQAAAKPVVKRRPAAKRPGRTTPTPKPSILGAGTPKFAQIKDMMMATPFDITKLQTAFADLQGKAKVALDQGKAALGDANDFAKGNVEAVVTSGKILSAGLQDLGSTLAAETRGAFDALTADAKELAAAKSPTEFFQLQSSIARKQFDGAVAQASKNTEAFLKLANDVFAPISGRVTLAVEKVSKAA